MSDRANVASKIFINEESELRSGWRILIFFILFYLAAILINTLLDGIASVFPPLGNLLRAPDIEEGASARVFVYHVLGQITNLAAALIATALSARLLEHRSLASVGYKLHRRWTGDFVFGSLIGAASLALAVGIEAAAGAVNFDVQTRDGRFLIRAFALLFCFFLIAGAIEELLFRGFAFQALVHNIGPFAAIAFTSILFGLAHWRNDNATIFSTINTILAGVWLGTAYLMTRSLWLATALHYSWNLVMVFVFGLPVSGITTYGHLAWLNGQAGSMAWLSGGDYGPEGGAAATVVLIISTLAIWKGRLFAPSEEMIAATRHGSIATNKAENPPPGDQ
ncbi:MAG TPA: CPBP family intramembrane glutamic endopeptidase [Blastocatellia bacterium]|nr:CPBP family intramembrane glutamic endopeptidase [Blastocatellia bacterium]